MLLLALDVDETRQSLVFVGVFVVVTDVVNIHVVVEGGAVAAALKVGDDTTRNQLTSS